AWLWDASTGRPASREMKHADAIATGAVAFSPDGKAVAIGYDDGSVRLWDAATARPIGPAWRLRHPAVGVAISPDGRSVLAVAARGNGRSWPTPHPSREPVERLIRRVQSRTAIQLVSTKEVAFLDPTTWRRIRSEIGGPLPSSDPTGERDWHEACARDAESVGDSFAARWHLDRLIAERHDDGLLRPPRAGSGLLSGDVRAAEADLARAIALGPRDRVLDWLAQRAEDFRADGRSDHALRLLDHVIAARPADWLAYSLRAEVLVALGRMADR